MVWVFNVIDYLCGEDLCRQQNDLQYFIQLQCVDHESITCITNLRVPKNIPNLNKRFTMSAIGILKVLSDIFYSYWQCCLVHKLFFT